MASRISLDRTVLNSGKTRHYRSRDFTTVPRLERAKPAPVTHGSAGGRVGGRWDLLFRVLRLG